MDDDAILAERVAKLEAHMIWVKEKLKALDRRTWQILAVIIVNWLLSIMLALFT